ncbi:hypothetical protein HanHA300_Chr10g0361541 [Helianthus annuus]|nr:hypothetical protein HanHA300_Chr10g0361541 [Helianthus annuus]KAJ0529869.1 hypothetical protein HanHA89_Chr10g0383031 [Helianthus annuus]KAJ0696742.1 hypothetical protein HanLR1_Chr10g0360751 [Helianthus annuus]
MFIFNGSNDLNKKKTDGLKVAQSVFREIKTYYEYPPTIYSLHKRVPHFEVLKTCDPLVLPPLQKQKPYLLPCK